MSPRTAQSAPLQTGTTWSVPPSHDRPRGTVPLAVAQRLVRSAAVLTRAAPSAGLRVRGLGLVQDERGTRLVVDYAPAEAS